MNMGWLGKHVIMGTTSLLLKKYCKSNNTTELLTSTFRGPPCVLMLQMNHLFYIRSALSTGKGELDFRTDSDVDLKHGVFGERFLCQSIMKYKQSQTFLGSGNNGSKAKRYRFEWPLGQHVLLLLVPRLKSNEHMAAAACKTFWEIGRNHAGTLPSTHFYQ